jgi:hypothetical protein
MIWPTGGLRRRQRGWRALGVTNAPHCNHQAMARMVAHATLLMRGGLAPAQIERRDGVVPEVWRVALVQETITFSPFPPPCPSSCLS